MSDEIKTPENKTEELIGKFGNATTVVFSFDTTGSMAPAIAQVRKQLRDLAEGMFADIPNLKMGLIAHGDYCDGDNCIKVLELTSDIGKIMRFINDTPNTSGGDEPECYELVLRTAQSFNWPESGGALILIGDASPHPKESNPEKLDWETELKALTQMNVRVFPMQCLKRPDSHNNKFWESVASLSDTPLLELASFADSADILGAAVYAASGAGADAVEMYTNKLRACKSVSLNANVEKNISKLADYASRNKRD